MIKIIPTDTCFGISCPISDVKNYEKIYKIKKRDLSKPLAIIVQDFKRLRINTILNNEQINFLKNYKRPFTILTYSSSLMHWLDYKDEKGIGIINNNIYEKIAFRIANNEIQRKLIKKEGPLFLTSANISNKQEIFKIKELKDKFTYYLDNKSIELVGYDDLKKTNPSDIFEFIKESIEINYLRKI